MPSKQTGFVKSSVGSFLGMQRPLALFSRENTSERKSAERTARGLRWAWAPRRGLCPWLGLPAPCAARDGVVGTRSL